MKSERQQTNNAHTTSRPPEGLHSDLDPPKLSQIQHITDERKNPITRHSTPEHKRLHPRSNAHYNINHTPPAGGATHNPTTTEKTSASTEEVDIPPPHYNHGTENTPPPLDYTHWWRYTPTRGAKEAQVPTTSLRRTKALVPHRVFTLSWLLLQQNNIHVNEISSPKVPI